MHRSENLKLSDGEIEAMFAPREDAKRYPPILTIDQAAALLQVPVGTLRDWRSRGYLTGCSRRVGKHVRFLRDRLVRKVFSEGLRDD
ncbi:MAG: helix-turn-helix domain-containing protein [Planctomycetaceae bacterium]|nr:helix-turn-helix domain-containing protein [Planctomycetaceae bacterium]